MLTLGAAGSDDKDISKRATGEMRSQSSRGRCSRLTLILHPVSPARPSKGNPNLDHIPSPSVYLYSSCSLNIWDLICALISCASMNAHMDGQASVLGKRRSVCTRKEEEAASNHTI